MYTPLTDEDVAALIGLTAEELTELESGCYDCEGAGCSTCS